MANGTVNGNPLTDKKNQEYQQQEIEQQDKVKDRAEELALKLARTYEELTRLLEQNPGVKREITEARAKEDRVYQNLKQRTEAGGHGSALPVGEAGRHELPVTAD